MLLQKIIPAAWRKKWYHLKHPGIIEEVDIAWKLLSKGDPDQVMLDVGAHFGGSLEAFARAGWRVFAFEPDPKNRQKLLALCQDLPNVKIEPIALSDKELEAMPFFSSNVSTGISSLLEFHPSHEATTLVPVTTLEKYCRENGVRRISFLKTDTEGYDLPVLRGFDWSQPHPRFILSEFDNHKTKNLGYDVREQVSLLEGNGYRVLISEWHPIEEYGKIHKWRRFVLDVSQVEGERVWGNVLAVKAADWDALLKIAARFGKIETATST
ncbi:MAG: FkbM family methyltransferase [Bacteroidota bacterium]